jgi:hypothetical protein
MYKCVHRGSAFISSKRARAVGYKSETACTGRSPAYVNGVLPESEGESFPLRASGPTFGRAAWPVRQKRLEFLRATFAARHHDLDRNLDHRNRQHERLSTAAGTSHDAATPKRVENLPESGNRETVLPQHGDQRDDISEARRALH